MRRVFGLETEYGFFCRVNSGRLSSRENVIRYVFERTVPGARSGNVFLENGGRLYLDTGLHPEYATPEVDQVGDLVTHDKAGERIVANLLLRARRLFREKDLSGIRPRLQEQHGYGWELVRLSRELSGAS